MKLHRELEKMKQGECTLPQYIWEKSSKLRAAAAPFPPNFEQCIFMSKFFLFLIFSVKWSAYHCEIICLWPKPPLIDMTRLCGLHFSRDFRIAKQNEIKSSISRTIEKPLQIFTIIPEKYLNSHTLTFHTFWHHQSASTKRYEEVIGGPKCNYVLISNSVLPTTYSEIFHNSSGIFLQIKIVFT